MILGAIMEMDRRVVYPSELESGNNSATPIFETSNNLVILEQCANGGVEGVELPAANLSLHYDLV